MEYIIFIIFLIWIFPNVIFILSLIPIYFLMSRNKIKRSFEQNSVEKVYTEVSPKSFFVRIKIMFSRYLNGYVRYFILKVGLIPSHSIRNFIYKKIFLVEMEDKSIIYYGSEIRAPYNLKIGKGSIIGDKSILDARNGIEIGENVNFSSNVSIWTEQHDHRDPFFMNNSDSSFRVRIDDRAWIGPNVIILHSVWVGEGAVVAAGSVVTKNIEPFSIVAGIPAKKIGERNRNLKYIFNGGPSPFY